MAEKRMFSRKVLETDAFYLLPHSVQTLYLHLCLNADDDGFIDNVMSIMTLCKCSAKDLSRLIQDKYVLQVSEHVYVIAHWFLNNQIQKDRFHPTIYEEEKNLLCRPSNIWAYKEGATFENLMDTENRLDQDKEEKKETKHKYGVYQHVMLTDQDYENLVNQFPFDFQSRINNLDEYLENNPKKHYANHLLTIRNWARRDGEKQQSNRRESWTEIAERLSDEMDLS